MKINLSLSTRIFIVIASVVFLVSSSVCIVIYNNASKSLFQEVRGKLSGIASTIASSIDTNAHSEIKNRKDQSSQNYTTIYNQLNKTKKANSSINEVYTMRPTEKANTWVFVVDSNQPSDDITYVGDTYDISDCPQIKDGLKYPTADFEPTEDKWGVWLSGYAPIITKHGKLDGIVGVDMSVSQLKSELKSLRMSAIECIFISLLFSIAVSLLLTRIVIRPINNFQNVARKVAEGDLDIRVIEDGCRELSSFAHTFNIMVAGLKESRDRMLETSSKDMLTGIYNHMYFHERLNEEIERSNRFGHPLSVLVLDLDRFKVINDNMGHAIGDSLLWQLANVIKSNLRSIDVLCRYGGDEFTCILTETDNKSAQIAAESIRKAVESHAFCALTIGEMPEDVEIVDDTKKVNLTITVGVATFPEAHTTKDGLFMAADIALCRAKHIKRNSVSSYDPLSDGEEKIDPQDLYQALHDPNVSAVKSLAAAVDAKDQYTCGHSERVAEYAIDLGNALGCEAVYIDTLRVAGLLHDLGKIGVPDAILRKPGSLNDEERSQIRQHPSAGGNILRRAPQLDQVLPAVLFHHERWDGNGYPNGLKGEEIPLIARILAIADAFDAMTSNRSYRKAMSVEAAISELRSQSGKQFDPNIVEAFIKSHETCNEKAA